MPSSAGAPASARRTAADSSRRSRTQQGERLLRPILRGAVGADAKVIMRGRGEHLVGVLEASRLDAVEPDGEGLAEGGPGLLGRTDEIGDRGGAWHGGGVAARFH